MGVVSFDDYFPCFWQVLKGPSLDANNQSLFCRLKSGNSPFTWFKEEQLSADPLIVLYHDVLIDSEARHIKVKALHKVVGVLNALWL